VLRRILPPIIAIAVLATAACSSGPSGSVEEFCTLVKDEARFAGVLDEFDVTDSARAIEQLGTARDQLAELRDAAPSEIKDDLSVLIDLIEKLRKATQTVDPTKPESARAAIEPLKPDFTKADDADVALESFRRTNCAAGSTTTTG
jgi:hypothetical protein